jgi:hypothetical protein
MARIFISHSSSDGEQAARLLAWLHAQEFVSTFLDIDLNSYGPDHPDVAVGLYNLAWLLGDTNRLAEAEPLMRRAFAIRLFLRGRRGIAPDLDGTFLGCASLLQAIGRSSEQIIVTLR